jgi:hypothetical protein
MGIMLRTPQRITGKEGSQIDPNRQLMLNLFTIRKINPHFPNSFLNTGPFQSAFFLVLREERENLFSETFSSFTLRFMLRLFEGLQRNLLSGS